jgi:hypothetical protein
MNRLKQAVLLAYVAAHFLVIVVTTIAMAAPASFPWPEDSAVGKGLARYGDWTGATNNYAFFSPNVADQVIVELTAVDAGGETTVEVLGTGGTQTDLRVFSMMQLLAKFKAQDLQGQSLAAYTFGRHPEAPIAVVVLRIHRLPSMAAARLGEKPYLEEFYRAVFVRGDGDD